MALSTTGKIEKFLAIARKTLADLQAECDESILRLCSAPDDAQLKATLDQLRLEIPQAAGRVSELQSALAKARENDTVDARAAERERLQRLRDIAIAGARKRVALAGQIDEAVAILGALLQKWSDFGELINEPMSEFTAGACPDINTRLRYSGDLQHLAQGWGDTFRNALCRRLFDAGLFRTGIPEQNIRLEMHFAGPVTTLAQASALAAERMARISSRFEQLADEQCSGAPRPPVESWAETEEARSKAITDAKASANNLLV